MNKIARSVILLVFFAGAASAQEDRPGFTLSLNALVAPSGLGVGATFSFPLERLYKSSAPIRAVYTQPAGPEIARRAVAIAWRNAGLADRDADLDAMASRARWSAVLPEARLRVLRHLTESTRGTSDSGSDVPYYFSDGDSLWLEGRFSWNLDRLVFSNEEPTIARIRLDRQEMRMRIATRVIEAFGKWHRANLELADAPSGTPEWIDAMIRSLDAATTLDVLTNGWFSRLREEP